MVKKHLGVAAALLSLLVCLSCGSVKKNVYEGKMNGAIEYTLNNRDSSGVWQADGWWNSANVLTCVIRYAEVADRKEEIGKVVDDTYNKAKHFKVVDDKGKFVRYADSFLNDYYDDEAWWALAWIKAYEVFGDAKYLDMAKIIFADITTGWDDTHGGGIFWKKNPLQYKNSIANNLFALTAIRLYNNTKEEQYLDWFKKDVEWYLAKGMYNTEKEIIEDGLQDDGTPNREGHYTYNQGVAIAVFTEMYLYTKDKKYLDYAVRLADSAITKQFVSDGGILVEKRPDIAEGNDGVQFKGIFVRHLAFLYGVTQKAEYKEFLLKNAESIITSDCDPATGSFGCHWGGPYKGKGVAANSSALECVVEAYGLTK